MRSSWNGRALLRGRGGLLENQPKGRNPLGKRQRLEAGGIGSRKRPTFS